MTSELKPCPFCGKCPTARSRMAGENEGYETTFIIRCECGSQFLAKDDLNKLGWVDAKGKAAKCKAVEGWNTRAVPDVPELVRYRIWFDSNYNEIIDEDQDGEYVRYDQAAAMLAEKDEEIVYLRINRDSWRRVAERCKSEANTVEAELAQIKAQVPIGYLTYEDFVWLADGSFSINRVIPRESSCFNKPLYAAPVDQTAEIERLRSLINRLVKWDKDYPPNCWNGYAGLKELDLIIEDARAALSGKAPS